MLRFLLTFGAGMIAGALGTHYLAGLHEGLHQMRTETPMHDQASGEDTAAAS